jgi:glutamate/tyrosine decarboxylase-like PLP-dependent enzyme
MPKLEHAPLLMDAASRAIRYLEGLDERGVAPDPRAVENLGRLGGELPASPRPASETLQLLDELGSPATMAMAGGRFFGFVIGGALPVTLASHWLSTAWDQNTGRFDVSPSVAILEEIALEWMVDLLGLPKGTGGGFVTGATVANLSALGAARHGILHRAGWDVEAKGLFGAPEIKVVVGEEVHPTLVKSLGVIGLGRSRLTSVPVDGQGRMRADRLPELDARTLVCVQAGNVNTGAVDPIDEICARAEKVGAWVHVDGAFGLWARASSTHAHLLAGIERAQSWATDAHKWLNVPYDSGIAFVREPEALRAAMAVTAEYLPAAQGHRDPSDYTPELSRRARGVDVWAALRTLGRSGVAEIVDRTCRHARRFADGLQRAGFDVINDVVLNQVLVSFGDAARTQAVVREIQRDGTCWCGGTVWQTKTAMRISVSSWATTDADVDKSLEAMVRAANRG